MNKIPEPALPPKVPCDACLVHTVSFEPAQGLLQACYCEHNQSGSILSRNSTTDFWRTYNPLSGSEFSDIVNQEAENLVNGLKQAKEAAIKRLTQKH